VPLAAAFVTVACDFPFPFSAPQLGSRSERKQERTLGRSVNVLSSSTPGLARASACFCGMRRTERSGAENGTHFRCGTVAGRFSSRAEAYFRIVGRSTRRISRDSTGRFSILDRTRFLTLASSRREDSEIPSIWETFAGMRFHRASFTQLCTLQYYSRAFKK